MSTVDFEVLRRLKPWTHLSEKGLKELTALSQFKILERGQTFQNPSTDYYVYVLTGEMLLNHAERGSYVIVGGSGNALFPLGHKPATEFNAATAITDVDLVLVDSRLLDTVLTWDQTMRYVNNRNSSTVDGVNSGGSIGKYLAQHLPMGLFSDVPGANLEQLFNKFERVHVRQGEKVIEQDDKGADYYYLIESGRARVTRKMADGTTILLSELEPNSSFGEEALLTSAPRNATVTMASAGVLLRLSKSDFFHLLQEPLIKKIDATDAIKRVASGGVWVDVRIPLEYQYDGIPEAINVPLDDLRDVFSIWDHTKDYVVYCRNGRRSSIAAFLLSQQGFHAYLLEGGLQKYENLQHMLKNRTN